MALPELYSKRGKQPQGVRYDLPPTVRNRLYFVLARVLGYSPANPGGMNGVLDAVLFRLTERYGDFTAPREGIHTAAYHFFACDTDAAARLVDEFNNIFRQDGIGFELTPMSRRIIKGGGKLFGHTADTVEYDYPIIRKRSDTPQEESMVACLDLLTGPDFQVANQQFLKAHEHHRKNEPDQAIAYCGSAFESVLKAVLKKKKVKFSDKAAANTLIQECVKAGIFPQVYANSLIGIANVRNAMSDTTHGRTKGAQIRPEPKHVEHLLYTTAANIVFIAKCV